MGDSQPMNCPICSGPTERVIELPDFCGVDQAFLFCESCSHGKLEVFEPQPLNTVMGEGGYLQAFAEFVRPYWKPNVLDIGGNDGALGDLVLPETYAVVESIETADLREWKDKPKLILSSHTLEHIRYPGQFFSQVDSILGPNDFLAIQVPSLELLVDDARIDQIHNQHYHYFSERSLTTLLKRYGMRAIEVKFNPDHWGAVMLICQQGKGEVSGRQLYRTDVSFARFAFTSQMDLTRYTLARGPFACYGASPMLPVLSYYLPIEDALFIADDFKSPYKAEDLKGRDVLITAVSKMTARKLVKKAFEVGARNVIVPFHQL